jgi:NADH-quinone oxidoreductase subunit M
MAQETGKGAKFAPNFQITMFILLMIGFAIKVPSFPFHTWLPDAHVEAPTPISMILAGVLLKIGGYGFMRIAYPIAPYAAYELAGWVAGIAVFSIIYGAFAAMYQTDFKKLVAYSSVSHMGYVTLGLAVVPVLNRDYYAWGVTGALFQMIAHGVSSAGMFLMVGVIYERAHHRDLNRFGGLMNIMPHYGGLAIVIFFAGMGLPGLCGFWGEVWTVLAGFKYNHALGIISALAVILTAGYILWAVQRVFFGVNESYAGTPDITFRERLAAIPLVVLAILLGVYPQIMLQWTQADVMAFVDSMTDYSVRQFGTAARAVADAGVR